MPTKGLLRCLTYVSRNLGSARLLVVGDVPRRGSGQDASPLRRPGGAEEGINFGRVILRGLNADEVHRMLKSITHDEVPWSLAEAVHRQTEGNPLFVQEVIRYLNEEGV